MASKAFMFFAYLQYLRKAGSRHSVHSPFVYKLIDDVFKNKEESPAFVKISDLRNKLLRKTQMIEITDFGTGKGRRDFSFRFESVSAIARKSGISEKYGRVLYHLVDHFKPATIIELGTSLGLSTLYMAMAKSDTRVFTIEGCTTRSEQAISNFNFLKVSNIIQNIGRFDLVLPDVMKQAEKLDFAFIDGNHTYKATVGYFESLLKISHNDTILVFDDIHWSPGMEQAWDKITAHAQVTVSIDLFRIGIVFLKKELSRQKFVIRF